MHYCLTFCSYRSSHNEQVKDWLLDQLKKSGKLEQCSEELHKSNDNARN